MSESKLTPIAVWAYLVVTVLTEVTILNSGSVVLGLGRTFVDSAILLLTSTQVIAVALFYMRIKYETKYFGLLLLGATTIGLMAVLLFLWGVLGTPIPHLK